MKRSPDSLVNIATLKSQLAKYLRMVRAGRQVIVTDHRQPVARIVPYESSPPLETIKPKRSFEEVAKLRGMGSGDGQMVDSLALLMKERGKR